MFMIKLRNVAILASAALLLAGTILSTMGIFTAYSAQTKEKEVYEEMLSGNQIGDFNATRTKIINTINMRNRAFTFLAYGMLSFGLGVTVFTLGSYQGTIIPKRWTFIPKRLRKHAETEPEKRKEELPVELGPPLVLPPIPSVGTITLRCKACRSSFSVEPKARPFKVKCPNCGAEGMI